MKSILTFSLFAAMTIALLAPLASADALPPDEQAFLDKHMADVIAITPKRLDDAALAKAISAPIYMLNIAINMGDGGSMTQSQMAAHVGDQLVPVTRPGTDGDCPQIAKMIKSDFALKSDDDAKTLQSAFDLLFPPVGDIEKKVIAFHHNGNEWQFIRGAFFDKHMGFVITTDNAGKITAVKYSLKL